MIRWRTDRPQGAIIVAKLKESFCDSKNGYEVLGFKEEPYPHYSDWEEVPYDAIEKWALIREKYD